jgi:hypothetical protein
MNAPVRTFSILALALTLAAAAHAQAPAAGEAKRVKVLVLDPTGANVEPAVLATVGGLISVELGKIPELDVITQTDVKKIAALEAEKQGVGCEESSCLAELAGAMGARLVVFGDANKLGSLTVINLSLFDSTKAQSIGRVSLQAGTVEEIPQRVPAAVNDLVRNALAQEGIRVADSAPPASATTTASAAPSDGGGPMGTVWMVGLIGVGAVLGLGGVGYDLVSPTSGDGALNGFDAIGPGLVGVGLAAVAVGIFVNPFATEASDG